MIDYARRHLLVGWWSLLLFATLGLTLEGLHVFKVRGYLDVSNETRRLMWTLAHAHGVLLSLVHIAFAYTLHMLSTRSRWAPQRASICLIAAGVVLPGGFFLGGIRVYGGDPGLGAVLVPVGAVLLLCGVVVTRSESNVLTGEAAWQRAERKVVKSCRPTRR